MEKDLVVEEVVVEFLEVVHEVVDPMGVQEVQEYSVDHRTIIAIEVIIVWINRK